jgi:hypothetical protein
MDPEGGDEYWTGWEWNEKHKMLHRMLLDGDGKSVFPVSGRDLMLLQ